jgi:HEAT repeat protein
MRLRPPTLLLGLGLALASFSPAPPPADRAGAPAPERVASDPVQLAAEEQAMQAAVQADDATAALDFFRKRTPAAAQRQRLRRLIRQLADDSFEMREQAAAELAASGPVANALLRTAARGPDAEMAVRARAVLAQVGREQTAPLLLTGVQLVARRRPPGTVAVLLAYLPFAEDESAAEEVRAALARLTVQDARPQPALLHGLDSTDPDDRAAAGAVLARANLPDTRPAVRRLLDDDDPSVRLRVGRALVEAKDKQAIPVLIELFGDLTGDDRWDLEDLLERVAAADAPALPRDDADATRRRRRDAWRGWWQTHGATLNLARLKEPPRIAKRLLLVQADLPAFRGEVLEIVTGGRPGRRIDGLRGPIAVERVAGGGVLIAEYAGCRVTEQTFDGKLLWEKDLPGSPVAVQRLPNGDAFVACRNRLLEFDRDGKETWSVRRPTRDVVGARKHADGSTLLVTHDGFCRWLDAAGRETRSFAAAGPYVMGTGIDLLPNRRVLVPRFGRDCVTEYDANGNVLWEAAVRGPASAERLPNGHTLVGCTTPPLVVELDRMGQVVGHYQPGHPVIQATRR